MTIAEILDACLKTGDEAAWLAFIARFQPLIAGAILRVCRRYGIHNTALVDDLVQETYLRLYKNDCHALRTFEARHEAAILGYLKVIATTVALDHFRARLTQKRGKEVDNDGVLPEVWVSAGGIEHALLLGEVDERLAASETQRDRQIFWLYYQQGFTARDIAGIAGLGLSQKGVESCIYRLTQSLRQALLTNASGGKKKTPQTTLGVME